jgi:hypothetical protein
MPVGAGASVVVVFNMVVATNAVVTGASASVVVAVVVFVDCASY